MSNPIKFTGAPRESWGYSRKKSTFGTLKDANSDNDSSASARTPRLLRNKVDYLQESKRRATNQIGLRKCDPLAWIKEDLAEEWLEEGDDPNSHANKIQSHATKSKTPSSSSSANVVETTRINTKRNNQLPEWKRILQLNKSAGAEASNGATATNALQQLFTRPGIAQSTMNTKASRNTATGHTTTSGDGPISSSSLHNSSQSSVSSDSLSFSDLNSEQNPDSSVSSKSPLKLFRKNHNTYTSSTFMNLLGSLEDGEHSRVKDTVKSSNSVNDPEPLSLKINRSHKKTNSAMRGQVTSNQYMEKAEQIMQRIRGVGPPQAQLHHDRESANVSHETESNLSDSASWSTDLLDQDSVSQEPELNVKKTVTATMKRSSHHPNMVFIGPETMKKLIPDKIGSISFDRRNLKWKRASQSLSRNTGSTSISSELESESSSSNMLKRTAESEAEGKRKKVDMEKAQAQIQQSQEQEEEEEDIFKDIEDLSDDNATPDVSAFQQTLDEMQIQDPTSRASASRKASFEAEERKKVCQLRAISRVLNKGSIQTEEPKSELESRCPTTQSKLEISTTAEKIDTKDGPKSPDLTAQIQAPEVLDSKEPYTEEVEKSELDVTRVSRIESSFSTGTEALLQAINRCGTPVQKYRELYESLNLTGQSLESLISLNEMCPKLVNLDVSSNSLEFPTGVPNTVRNLNISFNRISMRASFAHLIHLQTLDISHNNISDLTSIGRLKHLRKLDLSYNQVSDLTGIAGLDGLIELAACHNRLSETQDFSSGFAWAKLEVLNLSHNRIRAVKGLLDIAAPALIKLKIDHNDLRSLTSNHLNKRLRSLSLKSNKIQSISDIVDKNPGLKELVIDGNFITDVGHLSRRQSLMYLSASNQENTLKGSGNPAQVQKNAERQWREMAELHKLDISGSDFFFSAGLVKTLPISEPFLNLQTLELRSAGLSALPDQMSEYFLNVRILDLSDNRLENLKPLWGIPKLKRLYLAQNRVSCMDDVVTGVKGWTKLQTLDLRWNPLTLDYYPELPSTYNIKQTQTRKFHDNVWKSFDDRYLALLDPQLCAERQLYVEKLIRGCRTPTDEDSGSELRWLDGNVYNPSEPLFNSTSPN